MRWPVRPSGGRKASARLPGAPSVQTNVYDAARADRPAPTPSEKGPLMRKTHRCAALRRCTGMLAAVAAGAAVLSSCASTSAAPESSGPDIALSQPGFLNVQEPTGDPVRGGTLTFGAYSFPASLDPAVTQVSGYTGGTALAALYDTLMRYDTGTHSFKPQLARSLTAGDDGTTWTMTLRDGVTFSDGTPLDAAAVQASIDRYVTHRGADAQTWRSLVTGVDVLDPHTLAFHLALPWKDFPVLFTQGLGMVVAPASDAGGQFTPVGAGPFVLQSFAPAEALQLQARADYYGGAPYLDGLRFVPLDSDQARWDSLRSGQLDMTMVLSAELISGMRSAGATGYMDDLPMGQVMMINAREGRAGNDVRVRRAIVAAIDQDLFTQRVDNGLRSAEPELFPSWSELHPEVQAAAYDPELASSLLQQAEADGFDGRLTYVAVQSPETREQALAVQSMLDRVGFTVDIQYVATTADVIRRAYAEHDFDLMASAVNASPSAPYLPLFKAFDSSSSNNVSGFADEQVDALLAELGAAPDVDTQRSVIDRLQARFNEVAPVVNYGARPTMVAWNPAVHGGEYSYSGIMLLGKAWVAR